MTQAATIQRTTKLRAYPTRQQALLLNQYFGSARWVWNTVLAMRFKAWRRRGERLTGTDGSRLITVLKKVPSFAWLSNTPSCVLQQKLRDQDTAFANCRKTGARRPKFKKRRGEQAIRFTLDQRRVGKIYRPDEGVIRLPGLGVIKLRWSQIPAGVPKMVTIRRTAAGRHYVTFMTEEPRPAPSEPTKGSGARIGIDLGLKDLVVGSDGSRVAHPKHLRSAQDRLARLQKQLARKQKGSARRDKLRRRVAKLHERIADQRREQLHRLTTKLVHENQVIVVEGLNVKGMVRNHRLARAIADAAWGEFIRQLTYKAAWYGRELVVIDGWFPSSKLCSGCGYRCREMPLAVREWDCPACGVNHDRDVNAARNLMIVSTGRWPGYDARGGRSAGPAGTAPAGETATDEARMGASPNDLVGNKFVWT